MLFILKVIISAFIIALASELARRNRLLSATIISLPLISILSFIWIYIETKDSKMIVSLSYDIIWLVLISLLFFILFPMLIKFGLNFWLSLLISCAALTVVYYFYINIINS